MKPHKGTLPEIRRILAFWHTASVRKIFFLFITSLMWTLTLAAAPAEQRQHPLYISYEKRLAMSYLLAGVGEPESVQIQLADRLEKVVKRYMSIPPTETKVKNFDEFLKAYKGPWPNSYSVASDLSLIEEGEMRGPLEYKAINERGESNPALQSQIEAFIVSQNRQLAEKAGLQKPPISMLTSVVDPLFKVQETGARRAFFMSGVATASDLLAKQFGQLEKIGEQIASSGALSGLDHQTKLFIETILREYYSRLGLESKKQIVSLFLGDNLTAAPLKKFETMLMGAGPGFQKFLQAMAGNPKISPDLQEILKKLESRGTPIPRTIVKRILESERHIYNWVDYELDPLGTGTMAQNNRARIKTPKGEIIETAVRIPKPDAPRRVAEDARIMLQIVEIMDANPAFREAGFPKLKPVVEDSNKGVADELIRALTVRHQNIGREAYNRNVVISSDGYKNNLRVQVPFVIDGGSGSNLIVQQLVSGSKLESELHPYVHSIPHMDRAIIEQLASMWAQQAFFGSGFFHADLHQGNYLALVTDHEILISLLDFGMGGMISKEMQHSLVQIAMGLALDRPEMVSSGFWAINLPQLTTTNEAAFTENVAKRMGQMRDGHMKREDLTQWMGWAMDQGIRFPYEIVSLNRGMIVLDQALEKVGSPYRVSILAEKLAPRFGRHMILQLKQEGLFTAKELLKLGIKVIMTPVNTLNTLSGLPAASGPVRTCSKVYGSTAKRASGN